MNLNTKMERQDAAVKKMAKYLREGARMLDLACPECNNPIFQLKTGEKVCVVCERPVLLESEMATNNDQDESAPLDQVDVEPAGTRTNADLSSPLNDESFPQSLIYIKLKQACMLKLAALTKKILNSDEENASSQVFSNILKLLEILEKLRLF